MVVLSLLQSTRPAATAVFVDYGQAALVQEKNASRQIADHFGIDLINLRLEFPKRYSAGEIVYRNGTLIFAAAMATADFADRIAIGIHAGVPYPDCSVAFLRTIETALRESHFGPMQMIAPLKTWHKPEIIAYAKQEHLPLALTYSCEAGGAMPCGKCASCLDRVGL